MATSIAARPSHAEMKSQVAENRPSLGVLGTSGPEVHKSIAAMFFAIGKGTHKIALFYREDGITQQIVEEVLRAAHDRAVSEAYEAGYREGRRDALLGRGSK